MKQGDKKGLLAYGTTPSFPALVDHDNPLKGNQYIQGKVDELKKEYLEIMTIVNNSTRMEQADMRVTPIVGNPYYLYVKDGNDFVSIIAPEEWTPKTKPDDYVGCFKLTTNGVWEEWEK